MGESAACLTRSFSQPPSDEKKGNHIQRALTASVSFGRFMSESLDWEKWSAFTQNRYLEEAERYSKPGSVAEKKAYFEAHYKRRRAAALLEQQNAAAATDFSVSNTTDKAEDNGSSGLDLAQRDKCVVSDNTKQEIERKIQDTQMGCVEQVVEPLIVMENAVEVTEHLENAVEVTEHLENAVEVTEHLENDGETGSKQEYNICKKDDSTTTRNSVSPSEKKLEASSSKLLLPNNTSQIKHAPSVKPIMPVRLKNTDKIPSSKNDARDFSNKRRANTTSLHMSINLASSSCARKPTSPNVPKTTTSRLIRTPIRKSKNNVLLPQTSTRASVSGIFKNQSATIPHKLQNSSTDSTKFSSSFRSQAQSSTVSSSFTFKSEERVAKRKEFFEKLEQKLKSKVAEKQPLNAKSQVKARSDKNLHDSITMKATKAAEVPQVTESQNIKKNLATRPFSPKIQERAAFKVLGNDQRPPWRVSGKTESLKDVTGNNNRPPICSVKSVFAKKSSRENASPNIQL